MALIRCRECGREISDRAPKCPHCGYPLQGPPRESTQKNIQRPSPNLVQQQTAIIAEREKGFWSAGRLTIGIISMVLFLLISFQSCAAGLNNALTANGATSGTAGFLLAVMLLIAGIVGVCTRNSKSKVGPAISMVFYWLGALMTIGTGDTYGDLPIWGILSFIFGIVFLISAIKTTRN